MVLYAYKEKVKYSLFLIFEPDTFDSDPIVLRGAWAARYNDIRRVTPLRKYLRGELCKSTAKLAGNDST